MDYTHIAIYVAFGVYFIFSIIFYIVQSRRWDSTENEYLEIIDTQQEIVNSTPNLDIGQRVAATKELFSLIDTLIEYEIINNRRFEIFLEKKNKNLDFENVLQDVGQTVFESLASDVYTDKNNLVTKECIMKYIQKRVFVEYFLYLKNNNQGDITTY